MCMYLVYRGLLGRHLKISFYVIFLLNYMYMYVTKEMNTL